MYSKVLTSIFVFLVSIIQFSCVSQNYSKRIRVASSGRIESLDPARVNTLKSLQLLSSLGDTLYELNNKGELIPELALGMPILSEDKLQIIINLKKNILFHDGTPFDSEAIKFTFDIYFFFKNLGIICFLKRGIICVSKFIIKFLHKIYLFF